MSEAKDFQKPNDDDHWEIYVTYVDEKPAVILVDIGVSSVAPIPSLTNLVWLSIAFPDADEQGFPDEAQDDAMNDIEDSITDDVDPTVARYVGRITADGHREFFYYTNDPATLTESFNAAKEANPGFDIEIHESDDADWSHYWNVLYPSPEDFQQIHNEHVIRKLEQEGDSLTTPRPVDHFANFSTVADRAEFSLAAGAMDYETVSQPDRDDETEFPYSIGLLKTHPVDSETIDQVTYELFELASQYNGQYEGWGSKVVKS